LFCVCTLADALDADGFIGGVIRPLNVAIEPV
jgi:hypothetical protein